MSNVSPLESDSAVTGSRRVGARSVYRKCLPAFQFVGFWTAVLLPFILASLLVSGFVTQYPLLVGGLLALNFLGLVLGRNYNR